MAGVVLQVVVDKTGLPAAALLTISGLVYAVLPSPNVQLNPRIILTLVIPPLIYGLGGRAVPVRSGGQAQEPTAAWQHSVRNPARSVGA